MKIAVLGATGLVGRTMLGLLESADWLELDRRRENSFCCGAGGAQMWKEEEEGTRRISQERIEEARSSGAGTLVLGCPFCMIMLSDANNALEPPLELCDLAELVAARLDEPQDA